MSAEAVHRLVRCVHVSAHSKAPRTVDTSSAVVTLRIVFCACNVVRYSGPGAGRYPTANSVVSDIARIARGMATPPFPYDKEWALESDFTSEFYTRITCKVSQSTVPLHDVRNQAALS